MLLVRSLAAIRSTCINLVTSPSASASPHPLGAAAEARRPRPTSDPMTSMSERADTVPRSAEQPHRKSRSAAISQLGIRAVSNPFTFAILKQTTLPVYTPSKEELSVMVVSGPKAQRRHSFGTCFRSSNCGTEGTSWGVDRARRARRAVHRPVEWRMAKSWNQDQDRGRFLLSKRKSRRNPKLQRRWIVLP